MAPLGFCWSSVLAPDLGVILTARISSTCSIITRQTKVSQKQDEMSAAYDTAQVAQCTGIVAPITCFTITLSQRSEFQKKLI